MFIIDFNKLRFLVCDDNAHMRRILRTLLHSFGAREVYEAEDGATALEMYSHYVPDIVITDWSMPIFDGLELAQMIRQPEGAGNPYAPIIMLTGHSEKRRVMVARDAGVTEFLAKPISAKGLYQRILNVVANPRPFIKTKNYFGPDRRRNTNAAYIGLERRSGGQDAGQQLLLAVVGVAYTDRKLGDARIQEVGGIDLVVRLQAELVQPSLILCFLLDIDRAATPAIMQTGAGLYCQLERCR